MCFGVLWELCPSNGYGDVIHHHRFPKCCVIGATVTLRSSHPAPLLYQQHVTNEMMQPFF